jgi:hypothetical protein
LKIMNWGTKLTLVILVFIGLMAVMVIYSFRQDLNMVTDNYYEKDLRYQEQIEKIRNSKLLIDKPKVLFRASDKILAIQFPENLLYNQIKGEIHLYRPSDDKMDRTYSISLDERGSQFIDAASFSKGDWIVKLSWNDQHLEYYDEITIFVR